MSQEQKNSDQEIRRYVVLSCTTYIRQWKHPNIQKNGIYKYGVLKFANFFLPFYRFCNNFQPYIVCSCSRIKSLTLFTHVMLEESRDVMQLQSLSEFDSSDRQICASLIPERKGTGLLPNQACLICNPGNICPSIDLNTACFLIETRFSCHQLVSQWCCG